jgi:hypothetical protein
MQANPYLPMHSSTIRTAADLRDALEPLLILYQAWMQTHSLSALILMVWYTVHGSGG